MSLPLRAHNLRIVHPPSAAPAANALHLMDIVDPQTGLLFQAFVDVADTEPRPGDYIVISDGKTAVECRYHVDVPVPDDCEVIGCTDSILIRRR